jgi:hypothetical protein
MARDIAIDTNTGDLVIAPNGGFDLVTGATLIRQKIMVRLRIRQGEWFLDPTNGTLGSNISDMFRLPNFRAKVETEAAIREALAPMEEISVQNVDVIITTGDSATLSARINYTVIEDDGTEGTDLQTVDLTIGDSGVV